MEVYIVMYCKKFDETLVPFGVYYNYKQADAVAQELVEEHSGRSCVETCWLNTDHSW